MSHVVLGLVGEHSEGAHDLVRMMRRGGVYYAVASSQLYAEPKRLERLGYLSVHEEPGQTRARTESVRSSLSGDVAAAEFGLGYSPRP